MNLSPMGKCNKCRKPQVSGFLAAYKRAGEHDVLLLRHLTSDQPPAPPLNINAPQK